MKSLDLQSERYSPTGNIASEGVRNQLGRPRHDRLTILVREAAQNAWDARSTDAAFVTFGMRGWTLSPKQLDLLQKVVFAKRPPSHAVAASAAIALGDFLRDARDAAERRQDPPRVLCV